MLTDEIFWKMDLECVYNGEGRVNEIEDGFYVYLIVNPISKKYYVGLSKGLNLRIYGHINNNSHHIFDGGNTCVYILERLCNDRDMRYMECLWIVWFSLNTECVNVARNSLKIRNGIINKQTIDLINPNYKVFCDFEYINGIKLLDNYNPTAISEIEYFGKTL